MVAGTTTERVAPADLATGTRDGLETVRPPAAGRTSGMPGAVYLDGEFFRPEAARVSVFDHGLLYGDGVFEGIRFYRGRVFKLAEHVARMFRSAAGIDLVPPVSAPEMEKLILETAARSGLTDGYLRPLFTRGAGDLGLDPRKARRPSVIIICSTLNAFARGADTGIRVVIAGRRRTPPECLDPNVKSLNYLNNVLAKAEANRRGADDALLLDLDGNVSEATGENFFAVLAGTLVAPPVRTNLPGITRETVIDLARGRVLFEERELRPAGLAAAEEAFLCGTGAEVLPVVAIDGVPVGNGRVGAVTRAIQDAYQELVRTTGTSIPYPEPPGR